MTRRRRVADGRFAFADQHEREVGERRQVAARADRAAARDGGMHAAIQQGDQPLERLDAGCRRTLGQHVGAQRHRGAHGTHGQRIADARRVAAQQVDLQRVERVAGDRGFGQRAESGVDAVDRLVAARLGARRSARARSTR